MQLILLALFGMFCQKNVNVYTIDKVAGDIREALRYEQEQLLDDITYLQVKKTATKQSVEG